MPFPRLPLVVAAATLVAVVSAGATEATERLSSNLEGVVALLLFPFEPLLVASMKIVKGVLALAFGLGPQATKNGFDFSPSARYGPLASSATSAPAAAASCESHV